MTGCASISDCLPSVLSSIAQAEEEAPAKECGSRLLLCSANHENSAFLAKFFFLRFLRLLLFKRSSSASICVNLRAIPDSVAALPRCSAIHENCAFLARFFSLFVSFVCSVKFFLVAACRAGPLRLRVRRKGPAKEGGSRPAAESRTRTLIIQYYIHLVLFYDSIAANMPFFPPIWPFLRKIHPIHPSDFP